MTLLKQLVKSALYTTGLEIHGAHKTSKTIDEEFSDVAAQRIQESESASPTSRDQDFKLLLSLSLTEFGMFLLSLPNPKEVR